jgi:DNA-binding Xre family transcriptional regulator
MTTVESAKKLKAQCNLDQIMEARGINSSALHQLSGVAFNTIRLMKVGAICDRISIDVASRLMTSLECTFEELWTITWE